MATNILNQGSSGTDVKALQQQLNSAMKGTPGFTPLEEDGIYGSKTAAAVKQFQTTYNNSNPQTKITVDSIYGPQTAGALSSYKPTVTAPATPALTQTQTPAQTPVQTTTQQPVIPEFKPPEQQPYQSPYDTQIQQSLADYEKWKSQPYASQYADEIEGLITKIMARQFNYDPAKDQGLQLAVKDMTRNVLETMNTRGILNSTITADRTIQGTNELQSAFYDKAYTNYMNEGNALMSQVDMLMNADNTAYNRYMDEGEKYAKSLDFVMRLDDSSYQKWRDASEQRYTQAKDTYGAALDKVELQSKQVEDAWKRVSELGYVDNKSSIILGVPVGTPSKEAREAKQEKEDRLNEMKLQHQYQLSEINAQYEKEKKLADARAAEEKASTDVTKMGTSQQVDYYNQLYNIYMGADGGKYAGNSKAAYDWLVANRQSNVELVGDKLYNKLLDDVTNKMAVDKAYSGAPTTQQQFSQQNTVTNKALAMKNAIKKGGYDDNTGKITSDAPQYTNEQIVSYIVNSGIDAESIPSVLEQVFSAAELEQMGLLEE